MAEDDMEIVLEHGFSHDVDDDNMRDIQLEEEDGDQMFLEVMAPDTEIVDADVERLSQVGDDAHMLDDDHLEGVYEPHDAIMDEHVEHDMAEHDEPQSIEAVEAASFIMGDGDNGPTSGVEVDFHAFDHTGSLGDSTLIISTSEELVDQGVEPRQDEDTDENEHDRSIEHESNKPQLDDSVLKEDADSNKPADADFEESNPKSSVPQEEENSQASALVNDHAPDEQELRVSDETFRADEAEVNGFDTSTHLRQISVLYHSAEYSLFGSDVDDPNSFFFTDTSIADKPISDFFHGIRNVIHNEITEEDELCMSIDDFGLEIEETVCSLHDVTISQLVELHEKLVPKEDTLDVAVLRIHLSTRPSFAHRLANLIAGAADGKKLFEILDVEEYDSRHDDVEEGTEHDQESHVEDESIPNEEKLFESEEGLNLVTDDDVGADAATDSFIDQEGHENDGNTGDNDVVYAVDSQEGLDDLTENITEEQNTQPSVADTHESINTESRPDGGVSDQQEDLSANPEQVDPSQPIQPSIQESEPTQQATQATELEEEGDLIDYSEDEQDVGEIPTHDLSENDLVAQQDTINADLYRRSPSRAESSERQIDSYKPNPTASESGEADTNNTNADPLMGSPDRVVAALGVATHSESGPTLEEDDDYLDLSPSAADEVNALSFKETSNVRNDENEVNEEPISESFYQQDDEYEANLADENDYEQEAENTEESKDEVLVNWSNAQPKEEASAFDDLEHDEPAGSSATLSAGEAQVDDTTPISEHEAPFDEVENKDEDEIDYDDDDYGQDVTASIPEAQISPITTNGGTTKRSRQDDEDGIALEDPDIKRVKS